MVLDGEETFCRQLSADDVTLGGWVPGSRASFLGCSGDGGGDGVGPLSSPCPQIPGGATCCDGKAGRGRPSNRSGAPEKGQWSESEQVLMGFRNPGRGPPLPGNSLSCGLCRKMGAPSPELVLSSSANCGGFGVPAYPAPTPPSLGYAPWFSLREPLRGPVVPGGVSPSPLLVPSRKRRRSHSSLASAPTWEQHPREQRQR